jgi:hypothetical protein
LFFFFAGTLLPISNLCCTFMNRKCFFSVAFLTVKRSLLVPAAIGVTILLPALPGYSLEFPSTGDRGAPSRTGSGGSRGDRCQLPEGTRMSALMPHNNVSTFTGERASLWLHVPIELSEQPAEIFVSNPQTHEVVYQQQLLLPKLDTAGIIQLDLPAAKADGTPLLAADQDYFWEFATICDASDRSRDHVVQGFVHRLEASETLSDDLDDLSELPLPQQAQQYAAAEIWQQTLDIASTLKLTDSTLWSQLLTSVGLETLANEPVIESTIAKCCRFDAP